MTTITIPIFLTKYSTSSTDVVTLWGRVRSLRGSGKIVFVSIYYEHMRLQLVFTRSNFEEGLFEYVKKRLTKGTLIKSTGTPYVTNSGELSLLVTSYEILANCSNEFGFADNIDVSGKEVEYLSKDISRSNKTLDLILNKRSYETLVKRSKIINTLRSYLTNLGFIEVDTPILQKICGGANAKPFETYSNELGTKLSLRIAPEIYLKKLIIGGFNKIFEIGKNFRNEGIDATHNPEFTACEFYITDKTYVDLISMTEEILSTIVRECCGSMVVIYGDTEIDFTPPYRKINIVEELETHIGHIPTPYGSKECADFLQSHVNKLGLVCTVNTISKLFDKLIGHYIEPQTMNPTFLILHPSIMSPLAKENSANPELSDRFELFVCGKELCNSYSEQTDPVTQDMQFRIQVSDKQTDVEALEYDESFINSLRYGMPPTAGWGMGIDRLVMFLTNTNNIADVLTFTV